LLCAYFFTMLPLPSRTEVAKLTTPYVSLELFSSVKLLLSTTVFNIYDMSTWLPALLQPNCFTIYFNILMVIPLGIYLRYYFKKGWISTTIICFLVSLSFELIQLSGLFGIYSRPYRLFETDDLFFNTLGGIIGYIITPILVRYLPTKDELEETSYLRG
ncbi:MAG: VanZ family protein, partial [Erysipelotrichaceae bacterium]